MKCDMDCAHCRRPAEKCKGGGKCTAYGDAALRPLHNGEARIGKATKAAAGLGTAPGKGTRAVVRGWEGKAEWNRR